MPIESASNIEDLDTTYPLAADPTNRGDDHLRLIKSVLKTIFPGVGGNGFAIPITATEAELNFVSGVTSSIQDQLDAITATIQDNIYPVGSVYTNADDSTNPATLLGFGTWVRFGQGRVLVSQNSGDPSFNTAEEVGGTKDAVVVSHTHGHTLTDPGHRHSVTNYAGIDQNNLRINSETIASQSGTKTSLETTGISLSINSAGESGVNKNLQPYIVVYMWKRTA